VDLLVLDMIMGSGMDGLDTYREAIDIIPGQKAIILSGFSETDRVKTAIQLGVDAYVKKPFVMETIASAVQSALGCPRAA
jgi:DNA-binding NarL/FixJ family response regulator